MAVRFIFRAMTKQSDGCAHGERLQEPKGKLLAMVFDRAIAVIDWPGLHQFFLIATFEFGPTDSARLNLAQQRFARSKARDPRIIPVFRQAAPAESCHQNAESVCGRIERRINALRRNHRSALYALANPALAAEYD